MADKTSMGYSGCCPSEETSRPAETRSNELVCRQNQLVTNENNENENRYKIELVRNEMYGEKQRKRPMISPENEEKFVRKNRPRTETCESGKNIANSHQSNSNQLNIDINKRFIDKAIRKYSGTLAPTSSGTFENLTRQSDKTIQGRVYSPTKNGNTIKNQQRRSSGGQQTTYNGPTEKIAQDKASVQEKIHHVEDKWKAQYEGW